MSSTYFDRVIYYYRNVWKAKGLKEIIKQGVGNTLHPKRWYDIFSFLLVLGTIALWLIIAIALNPFISIIGAIPKPAPMKEFLMSMNGCGQHKKDPISPSEDNEDIPF